SLGTPAIRTPVRLNVSARCSVRTRNEYFLQVRFTGTCSLRVLDARIHHGVENIANERGNHGEHRHNKDEGKRHWPIAAIQRIYIKAANPGPGEDRLGDGGAGKEPG